MEPEVISDVIVRMKHARMCGFCSSGVRDWLALKGLDYSAFLSNGLPAPLLAGYKDPLADRMIEAAVQDKENSP